MLEKQSDISNIWRLCDELSVKNAALLVVGVDPASEAGSFCEGWEVHKRPRGYEAAKHAICNALKRGTVAGEHRGEPETDMNGNEIGEIPGTTDIDRSTVERDSLKRWLQERGIGSGFFFPDEQPTTDYLDRRHPRYAHKLAAAIQAWQAIGEPSGRTPKQALEKWLREHAAAFELTKDDGTANELGIQEVSKVANWKREGGASKTPSKSNLPTLAE